MDSTGALCIVTLSPDRRGAKSLGPLVILTLTDVTSKDGRLGASCPNSPHEIVVATTAVIALCRIKSIHHLGGQYHDQGVRAPIDIGFAHHDLLPGLHIDVCFERDLLVAAHRQR